MQIQTKLNEKYLYIDGDDQVPTIVLDRDANKFEFHGISIPEDAISFYEPIIGWFDLYKNSPNQKTSVVFKMTYINTASSKMIHKVINKLNEIFISGNKVEVQWHYHIDDEDMLMDGKMYLEEQSMTYELINYAD